MFGLPAMLWWGFAALIPVLIHLFARQRYRRVPWAAMEFLQRAFRKTRKRIRLEHLLLLLLRILAVILFILALADPRVDTAGVLGGGQNRRDVIVVLDDSFSMRLKGADGRTAFAAAKDQAARLVRSLSRERRDTVSLITAGRPAAPLLKRVDDPEKALAEIDAMDAGHGVTDYVGAFRTVDAISTEFTPGFEVYLFSDLQKAGFVPEKTVAAGASVEEKQPQELLQSLLLQIRSRGGAINVVAPPPTGTDNAATFDLRVTSKAAVTGVPTVFSATVRNFGRRVLGGALHFHVDGNTAPAETFAIDGLQPGAAETRDFRFAFRLPGHHYVEARFITDNLEIDNRRFFALRVRERLNTLVVDGDRRAEAGESESFFFTRALAPRDEPTRPSIFQVKVIEETSLEQTDLSKTDLLVLMNVALLSPRSARNIQGWVEDGGGLLVFLGDKVKADTYDNLLYKGGAGVLPARLLESTGVERHGGDDARSFEIQLEDVDQPPLQYFSDPDILPFLTGIPVYRFFRTEYDAADAAVRLLATYESRGQPLPRPEPALLEKTVGKGRSILVTTSGDADWNDMPSFPTMVPYVKELAYHLTAGESGRDNILVGQSYYLALKTFVDEVTVSRDGRPILEAKPAPREDERGYELELDDLDESGIYQLVLKESSREQDERRTRYLAVNVDPRESELERVDEDFLYASFPGSGLRVVTDLEEADVGEGRRKNEDIWWWLLAACVLFMALETALAQLFGHRARRTT